MSIGIWTPVEDSNVQLVFSDPLTTFARKLKSATVVAGTHMRFTGQGCLPIFVHTTVPTTDAEGFTGTPVTAESGMVLPRVSPFWIYAPYENVVINIDVGTLT